MNKFWGMLKSGSVDFIEDDCMVSGAALAYYTIFSLPPLLVMVFFIAGMFGVPEQKINELVSRQIGMPIPEQLEGEASGSEETESSSEGDEGQSDSEAEAEASALQRLAERQRGQATPLESLGPISKVIGILFLVFSATTVFAQLQASLNNAWEVEPDPEQGGWKSFLVKRGLSLGMVLVIAFLLLVSFVLTTLIDELIAFLIGSEAGTLEQIIGLVINNAIALLVATALFAAIFKVLPDATMRWRDIWAGAFLTALLFVIGKAAIGWYLQNSQMGDAWGSAASSMIALLVWVYYSSLIVLFGAELTQAWAAIYGDGIAPEKGAVRVVEEKKHIRGAGAKRQGEQPR